MPNLSLDLFSLKYSSSNQSMLPSIINTVYLTALTLLLSVPIGIFSAIYLAEYSRKNSFFVKIINIANETLSGIPSIVYGLFGFLAFVLIIRGKTSEVQAIDANLCYPTTAKARITDPALAGGALLDVGVYPINFIDMIMQCADRTC